MSFFAVQVGNSFGYFKSFKEAKDVYEQKGDSELDSIRKVSSNIHRGSLTEVGDDISHLSIEEYNELNEPNESCPKRVFTIGLPGTTMIFHRIEFVATFYSDTRMLITDQILMKVMRDNKKHAYSLAFIFDKCANGDSRPLEEIFDDMKQRGDMYEVRLGEFGILRPMGYENDTIEERHRLIYQMARDYSKLCDLITNQ